MHLYAYSNKHFFIFVDMQKEKKKKIDYNGYNFGYINTKHRHKNLKSILMMHNGNTFFA